MIRIQRSLRRLGLMVAVAALLGLPLVACGATENPCGDNPCGATENPCGDNPCGATENPCGDD